MPTAFERRLNELERKIPESVQPIDLEAAARAYAATLLKVDEMPREAILLHEAARRCQALLDGGRPRR